MIECTLPNYSAERYYLLSEIEDRGVVAILDEENTSSLITASNAEEALGVIYVLWNMSDHNSDDLIRQKIKTITSKSFFQAERFLVVLEVLIRAKDIYPDCKERVHSLIEWFHSEHHRGCIIAGISDKSAGTPALEKCLEMFQLLSSEAAEAATAAAAAALATDSAHLSQVQVEELAKETLKRSRKLLLVAATRQECLGHDPQREPDAAEGVFQRICHKSSDQYDQWMRLYVDYGKQLYLSQVARDGGINGGNNEKANKAAASSRGSASMLLLALSFVVLLISIVLVFFYSSLHA